MSSEWQLRREICQTGRSIHLHGLAAGTDGNISARIDTRRILITPSGSCLGELESEDLIVINQDGHVLCGGRQQKPSSEQWMHLSAYTQRPDIGAVIHAHPPTCISLTVADVPIAQCALPEVILAFGRIPVAPYATPATAQGAEAIRDLIKHFDALILDRHGSLTVGKSVTDARFKLEKLEHGTKVLFLAHQLGGARNLPPEEVAKLAGLRETFGLGRAEDVSPECLPPESPS